MKPTSRKLLAALSVGAVTLSMAPAAGASSGPGPNQMVKVNGGVSITTLPGVEAFGSTDPSTPETVAFVLAEQNLPQLEASVERGVANYLSVGQFAQMYGQSQSNIAALQKYLAQYGITTTVYPDDVDVVATGTAQEFDSALAIQQRQYYVPGQAAHNGFTPIPPQTVHANMAPPELPYRIAQSVVAILGLSNYAPFTSNVVQTPNTARLTEPAGSDISDSECLALTGVDFQCNTPETFASNYDLDPLYQEGAQGQGQTVGIVTFASVDPAPTGSGFTWAPQYFWQNVLNLPPSSRTLTVENVDSGSPPPSYSAGSIESDVDTEQAGGVAPDANVVVYQAPNSDFGYADGLFTAASQDVAGSVSVSWGESETYLEATVLGGQESTGYLQALDEALLELAAQGQSSFIASGDAGAYSPSADLGTANLAVNNPADSPYTTATGATTLPFSAAVAGPDGVAPLSVPFQRAWGYDYLWAPVATVDGLPEADVAEALVAGGGGGFSTLERMPSYQAGVPGTSTYSAVPYLTPTGYQNVDGLVLPTAWNFDATPPVVNGFGWGRAVPDVAADGDPDTGYLVYAPSAAEAGLPPLFGGLGGTSFVAPQMSGSTAVFESELGHRVGFWNPSIYRFATQQNSPFTPIDESGPGNDNLYYTGTPGTVYNQSSGLGYPDLDQLFNDFAGAQKSW